MLKITWAFIGLVMIGMFLVAVYGTNPPIPRLPRGPLVSNFNFDTTSQTCENQTADAGLAFGNTIVFSGCAILPTPCHILDANYNVRTTEQGQDIITVELVALEPPADTVCIQVLKPTSFMGSFDLLSLNFEVDIVYNGEVLERFAAIA